MQNPVSVRFRDLISLPVGSSLTQVYGRSMATSLLSILNFLLYPNFQKGLHASLGFAISSGRRCKIVWQSLQMC